MSGRCESWIGPVTGEARRCLTVKTSNWTPPSSPRSWELRPPMSSGIPRERSLRSSSRPKFQTGSDLSPSSSRRRTDSWTIPRCRGSRMLASRSGRRRSSVTVIGSCGSSMCTGRALRPPEIVALLEPHVRTFRRFVRRPWDITLPVDALRAAAIPTLVVSGGHHPAFERLNDAIGQALIARRVVVEGAGHEVQTVGGPFNDVVSSFWSHIETSSAP